MEHIQYIFALSRNLISADIWIDSRIWIRIPDHFGFVLKINVGISGGAQVCVIHADRLIFNCRI